MLILTFFAFLAGVVTILSPCILPILPVILASSVGDASSRRRPYGIVLGFVLSFTFFTLFLSTLVKIFGIPADALRTLSVIVIAGFGLSLLIPRVQKLLESLFSRLANVIPSPTSKSGLPAGKAGFGGGILIGLSLGLLWTPCVGPILASVISLAISGQVTLDAFIITLAFSLGTAIPMYFIIVGGGQALTRVPWLLKNTLRIQRGFGFVMILTALLIHFGYDRQFQSYILDKFPQYGAGLTKIEDNNLVKQNLEEMADLALAPELIQGGEWLNSEPLKLSELRGKVVLVDFWTYTCINCIRTLPYLKSWHEKYQDDGLVIIGVHSPEFEFEKNLDNVKNAVADFGILYPVMQDNDFATWRAYSNRYWPAKYLIDQDGQVRYTHFGEGDYDETESMIQKLLIESGASLSESIENQDYQTYSRTPELYLGSARQNPSAPIKKTGDWKMEDEFALPGAGASLTLSFEAKDAFIVMRPVLSPVKVQLYLDGDYRGEIVVDQDTIYTLVKLEKPGRHLLKLVFPTGNVELFAFTFG